MKQLGHIATAGVEQKYFVCHSRWIFPTTIKLDEHKLEVIKRGFLTKEVIAVKLEDLFNVELFEVPIFCRVRVIGKYVTGGHVDIPYVRKKDGHELHHRVTELLIAKTNSDQSGGQ